MNDNRVFFYINNSTHILDLAGAVQAFHVAINYNITYEIRYISDNIHQNSSANLSFTNLELFSTVDIVPTDIIIIAGFSLNKLPKGNKDLFNFLKKAHDTQATICSVCTGCFTLAEAGLLEGKEAGISAGIDGALHLVAKLKSEQAAIDVAKYMEYDNWTPNEGVVLIKK
jgi:transcriptional regulator GlxA family with amidase domain